MVHVSSRIIQGYKVGKSGLIEIASFAFLFGTLLVLYEIGSAVFLVLTRGFDALQTVEKFTGYGITELVRLLYVILEITVGFLIEFASGSPILTMIAGLIFILAVIAAFVAAEGALIFLMTYITLSFYPVTVTINWNAFTGTYNAAAYPIGPIPYLLIPPMIITLHAYQLASHKLERVSTFRTLINGTAIVIGYEIYAVFGFVIFVAIPKAFVAIIPGWEWFIRFNYPLPVILAITLVGYPIVFGLLGGTLAALAPEILPEYDIGGDSTALLLQVLRDTGAKLR